MMSKKSPQLRFEGFTDDWEERKLGEVATFLNGRAYKQDELLDSGKYKVLRVGNFYTNDSWYYSNMELGDKYYVDKGDLVYTWSATFGPHIWSGEKVIYHYHIWKVELSKFLDRNFTLQLLEADKARLLSSTNGSTMIHVTKGDMESKIVSIPNIDEQKQIGSFFKQLDETIALHQRKLDLLKEQKKGYLQKMFPKNGAKVPELRFAGFADDWEERKLKELGDIQTGNTPPTSDSDNYSLDGVLWVTPTDIKSLVISNTAKKLSQVGVTKARIAKAGSILVTSIASIGKNTLLRMDAGFNQQINSLTPTSENDSYFLLTQSEKWSEKMKQTAASATMQIVNKTDFSNISTYVPVHKEEQEKIGSFFKQLDDTIALHQRKLDLLKEQKKGFLQKMFV